MNFTGILIEESLTAKMPYGVKVLHKGLVPSEEEGEFWSQLILTANLGQINRLAKIHDGEGWHSVFARGRAAVVVFQNKTFRIDLNNKATWGAVYEYGKSVGLKEGELNLTAEFEKLAKYRHEKKRSGRG